MLHDLVCDKFLVEKIGGRAGTAANDTKVPISWLRNGYAAFERWVIEVFITSR